MQAAAYPIVFTSFGPPPTFWRAPIAVIFGLASLLLMWTAIPALGKHWRLAAGVYEDHELVQSGPYGVVRHPIYASMLALLLATGLVLAPWFRLAIAVVIFCVGTLIRIQSEEKLLAERFGDQFAEYRKRVRAIIPWLW